MELELLRRVVFFCALWSLQCCASVLGAISRDAIFLRSYAASSVALLTLTLSLSTAYALSTASQLTAKLASQSVRPGILYALSPLALGSGLLALTLLSLAAPSLARATSVLLYLWLEVATQWLTQQFWDLCAKAFDVAQSKKFFGVITFGSTFGSLLASFVVLPAVQSRQLPTEFNLLVSAGMLFFVAGVLLVSAEHFAPNKTGQKAAAGKKRAPAKDKDSSSSSAAIISDIQARTYLKHICFFDMMATVMRVLVDNTTLTVVSLQPEEEVKASLSMINGLQSFLMIPMQLLSGPFFTHFGVMYGIAMLPATIFLFGASTYVSNSAYSLIFTRALYNAVSQAIFNPARQLLWLPFNESERGRFQNFVCGPFRSLSRIFGAVLSMFLTASLVVQFIGTYSSSVLMIATSAAWFVDAIAARKSYASEFYASLRQGYLDLTSSLVDFTPDQIMLVKETLVNGEQNQANFVLSSLSHEHIGLFSQELRALFYKKHRDGISFTPMHTKLRLLNLHTAAKREFVLHAQESYLLPDASTFPTGIFNTMDLMMLMKDKSIAVPRQLRVAAILACGYEKFNMNADQCSEMLHELLHNGEEEKSVVVCAAVALLRLSDWMDEEANVILQRLLHEEKVLEARVVGLKIVGKELPELLGDGFLVYLLHHSSTQIVQAAVECCSNSSRNSRMLIPALMKHLANSVMRSQIVAALKGFNPAALWGPLCQYTEEMLQLRTQGLSNFALASDRIHNKREGLAGALKVLDLGEFPFEDKLDFLLHLIETLLVPSKNSKDDDMANGKSSSNVDVLHHLFGKDVVMEELVVDALLSLISSTDEKTMNSFSQLMDPIHHALSIKIHEAHKMRHVLELFFVICPRTATNIEETSPLLLQHVEHSLKDTLRLLLKLLSTGFPKEFDVAVILEGMQSDLEEVHSAIQEVLENLLPSAYKGLVLPLLFPKLSATKAASKMEKNVVDLFDGKDGVDILLDVMKHQETELEFSALALQYFLHIAGDHAEHLSDEAKLTFQDEIIPSLLGHELTKELLIETYHRPEVLPYESVSNLKDCEPPLLSRIAVANCLRVSSLFENVCAISILRVISHHFVPITVKRGETFAIEGNIASAMYVVAVGTVQLHKERRILAELGFGTCVGQAALLQHSLHAGTHISSATALTDCILLSITREDLDALIKETPQVSRGVLNAVASSLQLLYFEPLRAIAQSGSLPRRDRRASLTAECAHPDDAAVHPMLKMTESLTTIKAALSVDRAAKSFLYNVGRSRTAPRSVPLSLPGTRGRRRSLSNSPPIGRSSSSGTLASKGLLTLSDPADYTTFEKCIHLKASHLMRNLDDDKVSLVAQLSRVVVLSHADALYSSGTKVECVYVIIDGTMEIASSQGEANADATATSSIKLHGGDCFGEESFVPNAVAHSVASAVGRCTLFEITTKELIDLSELHHDIMHVLLAWLSQTLAESTKTMIAPLLSPTTPTVFWEEEEEASELRNRMGHLDLSEGKRLSSRELFLTPANADTTMDFLASLENPNNQESLPAETLQAAHDASVSHTSSEGHGSSFREDEVDFASLEQRSRKKPRVESNDYQDQTHKLQQEIAEVKDRLGPPRDDSTDVTWQLRKSCIETKQAAATMKRKLAEHAHWLQRVGSLMETAPLFDFAVQSGDELKSDQVGGCVSQPDLNEWRGEAMAHSHPRLILDERVRAAVGICQENAARILREAATSSPSFNLTLKFESHGWKIATGILVNDNIGFTCHRVLPAGLNNKSRGVAMALWNSVEQDAIFRSFAPLVLDSIITHQEAECSLSCRILQLSQEMNQQAVATVESIVESEEESWLISVEAVHDLYLCTFVADACGDSVMQKTTAPPVKLDLGLQMSKLNMHNKFVLGARVTETDEGVDILIAGSAHFDLPCYSDPAFDLLQHFVSHMPVYEDLHLTPLVADQTNI